MTTRSTAKKTAGHAAKKTVKKAAKKVAKTTASRPSDTGSAKAGKKAAKKATHKAAKRGGKTKEPRPSIVEQLPPPGRSHHLGPRARQGAGQVGTEPARRTGHDGHPASEIESVGGHRLANESSARPSTITRR